MGRRRVEPEPEPPSVPEFVGPPDELEQAIAGLPQDSSVITLYRIPDQGKPRYITKLTPEEFDLEHVKRQFGGGRFRYVALQDGIKVQEGHFDIEGDPILGGGKREEPVSREVSALGEKLDRLVDALSSKPASDLQEKLLTAVIAKLADRKEDHGDFLSQLAALRAAGLFPSGGGEGHGSHLLEAVKLVKEGMMLTGGGEGGTNPWLYAVEKLAPSIEKTVDALTAGKGGQPEKPVEKPVPTVQVSEACRPFVPILRLYLSALIAGASMNASPETWADTIEENVPPDQLILMRTWLQAETWFKDLCILDRRIGLQAAWWQALRILLLEETVPEEEPGPEAA